MNWIIRISICILGILLGCAKKPPHTSVITMEPKKAQVSAQDLDKSADRTARMEKIKTLLQDAFLPVYFPYDEATLSNKAKAKLAEAGRLMKEEPSITVIVEGNADERGTEEYNLALGEKRAHTAKAYLVAYGLDPSRIRVISYGEEKPAAHGNDERAWSLNRRDEFRAAID